MGVPYYDYSITDPQALLSLSRPLYYPKPSLGLVGRVVNNDDVSADLEAFPGKGVGCRA